MTTKKPETPEEQWDALARFALEGEAREPGEGAHEEVRAELASRGVDLEALDQRGDAFFESLERLADESAEPGAATTERLVAEAMPVSRRSPQRQAGWSVVLLAAAVLAMLGGGKAVMIAIDHGRVPEPEAPDPTMAREARAGRAGGEAARRGA